MAVQAQHPSNLLLQNRSIQEGKNILGNEYSLTPQAGGFLDQSLFNNGVLSNPRKRGRREFTSPTTTKAPINSFSMQPQPQPQPSQLVDLTQLHVRQANAVSTGLRLAFGDQQQQQQQLQHRHSLSPQSSLLSEDLATEIRHQRDEIERFLQVQGEQMRRLLTEKRERHYRELLGAAEESVMKTLRAKEMEVEKAARRNAELEARAAQLNAEAQLWQARARAQEAAAASLQAQLQQAMMSGQEEGGGEGGGEGQAEVAESAYIDPGRVPESSGPSCKACGKRVASVVLLPCRHLCLCTQCDAVAQACPLCLSFRNSSVEVFLC